MYLAHRRCAFLKKLGTRQRRLDGNRRRLELLRLARRAFALEPAQVHQFYLGRARAKLEKSGRVDESGSLEADAQWPVHRRRLRVKTTTAPACPGGKKLGVETSGGVQRSRGTVRRRCRFKQMVCRGGRWRYKTSGDVEASGGIQAAHGVAKSAPTTPSSGFKTPPIRCRSISPSSPPSTRRRPPLMAHVDACTQTMLASGDVQDQQTLALPAGGLHPPKTPSWNQHFNIRGPGPFEVHSCIVSHIVDLRTFYGDIAASDILGTSLRCLHRFEGLAVPDPRWGCQGRGHKVAIRVKAAAILGLAIKLVVSADCTDEVPVSRLWAKVAGKAHVALVKALEIQLVNQWPGLEY